MATCIWTTLPEACSELIWGGYKNGCNVSRLPSSAQHCTSVLVTAINDHLATSIIDIKINFTPKGLKGHLRLLEDELAPFFLHKRM